MIHSVYTRAPYIRSLRFSHSNALLLLGRQSFTYHLRSSATGMGGHMSLASPRSSAEFTNDFQEEGQNLNDQGSLFEAAHFQPQMPLIQWSPDFAPRVLLQLRFLIILLDSANLLITAPLMKTFEKIICSNYYRNTSIHSINDSHPNCKIDAIQEELAFVWGWKDAIGQIPSNLD